MNLIAYIDGSCMGNPGESGCGMILKDDQGNILEMAGYYLGRGTNNTAEYQGLIRCLYLAKKYHAQQMDVYSDSQLLVNQIRGGYRIKKPHLVVLYNNVLSVLKENPLQFDIFYIPREQNHEADGLAKKAIRLKSDIHEVSNQFSGHSG